ncbi:PIN domain-containing protein [Cellulomonas pakistanensis]|uniref:Ribonuclease VapC n=1 Tax=Cellulomonas pakistanensis TaxID=992287 RepID=A0A919U3Z0_9CELL|nr:PIN domain-containing protein [Cellulomonas pakistanensis]GIG36881.1 VapC ribonuclease Y4jK [Cellulomonas pakistanensis]
MIVVDTNVWSEPLRQDPDEGVLRWMRAHAGELLMPALVVHEMVFGVELLPPGARRDRIAGQVGDTVRALADRVLAYDAPVAATHARLRAAARAAGHEPSAQDGQIAAHAAHLGIPLATRNVRDFRGLGVEVVDPWR